MHACEAAVGAGGEAMATASSRSVCCSGGDKMSLALAEDDGLALPPLSTLKVRSFSRSSSRLQARHARAQLGQERA